MDILSISAVQEFADKTPISGACLLQSYTKQPTKVGTMFMGGVVSTSEGSFPFKAWNDSAAFNVLDSTDLSGKVVVITGKVNLYQGTKSLILESIFIVTDQVLKEAGISESDFLYSKYDIEGYWQRFNAVLSKNLSNECYDLFNQIIAGRELAIKNEFAAVSHHDNCRGGLLAHTFKVCQLATIVKLYPAIFNKITPDLLYLGCAIHDIGKIVEYSNGVISPKGQVLPHPVIGAIMVAEHKSEIVVAKGEDFYNALLSIVSSHHGEYGEPPRTLAAYIIHKLDLVESIFTSVNELVESSTDGRIVYDGLRLS